MTGLKIPSDVLIQALQALGNVKDSPVEDGIPRRIWSPAQVAYARLQPYVDAITKSVKVPVEGEV